MTTRVPSHFCKHGKEPKNCFDPTCLREEFEVLMAPSAFTALREDILKLVPHHRKVFMSIKDLRVYEDDINIKRHTHLLLFCVKWLHSDLFQPIAAFMYTPVPYLGTESVFGKILGEIVKALLSTIHLLTLTVIAIVSPKTDYYEHIIGYLTESNDFQNNKCSINFYSEEFGSHIVLLYDINDIQLTFQNVFKTKMIKFKLDGEKYVAHWEHIIGILDFPHRNKSEQALEKVFRDRESLIKSNLFTKSMEMAIQKLTPKGLFPDYKPTILLIQNIRKILQVFDRESVDVKNRYQLYDEFKEGVDFLNKLWFRTTADNSKMQELISNLRDNAKSQEQEGNVSKYNINIFKEDLDNYAEIKKDFDQLEKMCDNVVDNKENQQVDALSKKFHVSLNNNTISEVQVENKQESVKKAVAAPPVANKDQSMMQVQFLLNVLQSKSQNKLNKESPVEELKVIQEKVKKELLPISEPTRQNESPESLEKIVKARVFHQDDIIKHYITCLKSIEETVEHLHQNRVPFVHMDSFNCAHIETFLNILKYYKNYDVKRNAPFHYCKFFNYDMAINTFKAEAGGLFYIKQN